MREPKTTFCRGCRGENLSLIGHKDGFDFLRCAECKTVVVDPYPSDAELSAFYNSEKSATSPRKKSNKARRAEGRVKRILRHGVTGKRFLDIGCNVGYLVDAACRLGLEAHGIDIDAGSIETAKKNSSPAAVFEAVTAEELAERGDTFDTIYMSEVIEHVREPEKMIALASRLLRPGGLLYITAPDAGHFLVPKDFLRWNMVHPPAHLTYFTRQGMQRLLGRHGLSVEKYQWAFKPGMKAFVRKTGRAR